MPQSTSKFNIYLCVCKYIYQQISLREFSKQFSAWLAEVHEVEQGSLMGLPCKSANIREIRLIMVKRKSKQDN